MTSMRTLRRRLLRWHRYIAATGPRKPARAHSRAWSAFGVELNRRGQLAARHREPPGAGRAWLALHVEGHRSEMRSYARWRRTGGDMPSWLAGAVSPPGQVTRRRDARRVDP